MVVKGDQGDSAQQVACLPCAPDSPPSTPDLLALDLMPATGMRPDLPSILSLYIKGDHPFPCFDCCQDTSETDPPADAAPVVLPTASPTVGKGSLLTGKGKKKGKAK